MMRLARRVRRGSGTVLAALSLAVGAVGTATAHGAVAADFQTPLPLELLLAGAGATVALTAVLLGLVGEFPAPRRTLVVVPSRVVTALRTVGRAVFLVAVVGVFVVGLTGRQVAADNAATVFVWPVWMKGLALVAVLVGSVWPALSPWHTGYDLLCRIEGGRLRVRAYPAWLGSWPALVSFLVLVGIVENLTTLPSDPAQTAGLVAALTGGLVAGALVFGREWFERADPLTVFYRLLGRTAPLRVVSPTTAADGRCGDDRDGAVRLVARAPWRETARPVADAGIAAVVVAAVYTVSFDGFVETPTYQAFLFAARDALGIAELVPILLYLGGFAGFLFVFRAVARLTTALGGPRRATLTLAPTVIPIAAGYEVAHNYPFVLRNLGRLPGTVGLGTADPLAWLSLPLFWGSQVVLIVLGHVVAVAAAHRVAVSHTTSRRQALVVHAPMVVLMVGYTVLSLWVVSQPVVA